MNLARPGALRPGRKCEMKKQKKKAPPRRAKRKYTLADVHRTFPSELREVLEETRQLIRDTLPQIEERVYSEGRGIGYHVPGVGVCFGVFFTPRSVALVFPQGPWLPDPEHLLDGHAKKSWWVNLRPGKPIKQEALSRLLLAAVMD